jgi:3'-phosphoadenosine 5'-phosphosulfate sulfotransferase (PAPS reductase)/FAD synthetase
MSHLAQLEAESIHIIREVAAEFENPVMLYSIGKDSGVMAHLAKKAFAPAPVPFPFLHIDITDAPAYFGLVRSFIAIRDRFPAATTQLALLPAPPREASAAALLQRAIVARNYGCAILIAGGEQDRKSTRLNSSHNSESRMPSSA